jgi:hypothetical protein
MPVEQPFFSSRFNLLERDSDGRRDPKAGAARILNETHVTFGRTSTAESSEPFGGAAQH